MYIHLFICMFRLDFCQNKRTFSSNFEDAIGNKIKKQCHKFWAKLCNLKLAINFGQTVCNVLHFSVFAINWMKNALDVFRIRIHLIWMLLFFFYFKLLLILMFVSLDSVTLKWNVAFGGMSWYRWCYLTLYFMCFSSCFHFPLFFFSIVRSLARSYVCGEIKINAMHSLRV